MFRVIGQPRAEKVGQHSEVFFRAFGPASYDSTNKIALDPAALGTEPIRNVDLVQIDVEGAYHAEYDYDNKRVTVYDLAGTEKTNATDLSAVTFRIKIEGTP